MMGFEHDPPRPPPSLLGQSSIDLPEDSKMNASGRSLSRSSSFNSIDQDAIMDELVFGDELDKLSSCLSEASSETHGGQNGTQSTSVIYDIIQAQLALWTCVGSLMYSYAWRQHRKKFIISIFFVIPTVIAVCFAISGLLTTIVILSRVFSTPFAYHDFLSYANGHIDKEGGDGSPQPMARLRSYSGTSTVSSNGDDLLAKPLCRRHSSSSSVCGVMACSSRPPSRKLSYSYSHKSASHEMLNEIK
ncbi:hypothetical protein PMAYCL1PPCAC_07910 [Pristionchus mayeri]|uniref:Uncharacterized protein n=1 Tax=Pristionchus mayeri TaxID=1317129 RepID=A0AAN5CB86_9BILA|nr:hypothetical protein PMAYCL1PPCAC_07910 [Pristionchus mayeri]